MRTIIIHTLYSHNVIIRLCYTCVIVVVTALIPHYNMPTWRAYNKRACVRVCVCRFKSECWNKTRRVRRVEKTQALVAQNRYYIYSNIYQNDICVCCPADSKRILLLRIPAASLFYSARDRVPFEKVINILLMSMR